MRTSSAPPRPRLTPTARILAGLAVAVVALATFAAPAAPGPLAPSSTAPWAGWTWPLQPAPAVARGFERPPLRWSAGHRGVDLVASPGQPVRAPAAGRVLFAGTVVDRGVLTLQHLGGIRTTYQPVVASVQVGDLVRPGEQVALVAGTAGHCAPATCLHWGARRLETYLDPVALLRPPGPPVLLPLHGRARAV